MNASSKVALCWSKWKTRVFQLAERSRWPRRKRRLWIWTQGLSSTWYAAETQNRISITRKLIRRSQITSGWPTSCNQHPNWSSQKRCALWTEMMTSGPSTTWPRTPTVGMRTETVKVWSLRTSWPYVSTPLARSPASSIYYVWGAPGRNRIRFRPWWSHCQTGLKFRQVCLASKSHLPAPEATQQRWGLNCVLWHSGPERRGSIVPFPLSFYTTTAGILCPRWHMNVKSQTLPAGVATAQVPFSVNHNWQQVETAARSDKLQLDWSEAALPRCAGVMGRSVFAAACLAVSRAKGSAQAVKSLTFVAVPHLKKNTSRQTPSTLDVFGNHLQDRSFHLVHWLSIIL